ncbi:Uncharacterised protein [Serratia plymuthica]|nr:Uncharacterised protein [Serratia plymuthica]
MCGNTSMGNGYGCVVCLVGPLIIITTLINKKITDYSLEQQASIMADYWLLLVYGIETWRYYQKPGRMGKYKGTDSLRDINSLYQKIIMGKRS